MGLSALIADLDQRGMLDETMVVAVESSAAAHREGSAPQETATVMMVATIGHTVTQPASLVGVSNEATSTESQTRPDPLL